MMADILVKRPHDTRTTTNRKGVTYVQVTAEKRYDKVKKFNVDKRVCIGRMVDDEYMVPNDKFATYFPDLLPVDKPPVCSDVLKIGNYVLFSSIMKNLRLDQLIDEVYEEDADLLKDVLSYLIIEENSALQHFDHYGFDHPVFSEHVYSDNRISEILHRISIYKHDLFLEKWNELHKDTEDIYISYDSTNMNSAAEGAQLLAYGNSKDKGSDLPQINVSIGFDQNNLTPLFYEVYPGNVIDNTQCELMVDKVRRYGYKKIGFVIDRGYFSIENIKYFIENGYEYMIMAKLNATFVQDAFHEAQYGLRLNPSYYLAEHEVSGMTVKRPFTKEFLKDQYMHVYYDDVRASLERRALSNKFNKLEENLQELTAKKTTRKFEVKKYEKYYALQYHGDYLIGYKRKESAIKEKLDTCGYFVLITSKEMSAAEALSHYRYRDTSEKLFLTDKTFLDADVLRAHTDETIESRQMIQFLALIVRDEIFKNTKKLKQTDRKIYTVPAVLRELEKVIITKDGKGRYRLRYALTKTQKTIFDQFNIKEKELKNAAMHIAQRYSIQG